jgi:hypothetical protein
MVPAFVRPTDERTGEPHPKKYLWLQGDLGEKREILTLFVWEDQWAVPIFRVSLVLPGLEIFAWWVPLLAFSPAWQLSQSHQLFVVCVVADIHL